MKLIFSTLTAKGRITIPLEVRRRLGITPHDKVAFIFEGEQVRLAKIGSVVEYTANIFKTNKTALTAEELREEAERAIAEDVIERRGDK